MTGFFVVFVGVLVVVAGLAWMLGPWALIVAGGVLAVVGLFVDFDRMKEPPGAKRHSAAS